MRQFFAYARKLLRNFAVARGKSRGKTCWKKTAEPLSCSYDRGEHVMNHIDIILAAILLLFAIFGYRRGLVKTLYRLVSFFIAIFIAWTLYPHVADFLRQTALFPTIQNAIANTLNLEEYVRNQAATGSAAIIDNLPLPAALQQLLHNNYNPDMFEILRVSTLEEYISGFFANIIINAIAIVAVYLLTIIILTVVGAALDIVSKLPVINTLNRLSGFVVGLILGGVVIWLGLMVIIIFAASNNWGWIYYLEHSAIAGWLLGATLPQLAPSG